MKDVRLYTRTLRSEHAVATIGSDGCGAVCHVRELEGGARVARGESVYVRESIEVGILEGLRNKKGVSNEPSDR